MSTSDIFGRLAISTLIIAAAVALCMVALNDWEMYILGQYIGVFYAFGLFFVLFVVIALIAAVWDH